MSLISKLPNIIISMTSSAVLGLEAGLRPMHILALVLTSVIYTATS